MRAKDISQPLPLFGKSRDFIDWFFFSLSIGDACYGFPLFFPAQIKKYKNLWSVLQKKIKIPSEIDLAVVCVMHANAKLMWEIAGRLEEKKPKCKQKQKVVPSAKIVLAAFFARRLSGKKQQALLWKSDFVCGPKVIRIIPAAKKMLFFKKNRPLKYGFPHLENYFSSAFSLLFSHACASLSRRKRRKREKRVAVKLFGKAGDVVALT